MSLDQEQLTPLRPFTDSSSLLTEPDALRRNLARDGYLFLPGLLPLHSISAVYEAFAKVLVKAGVASRIDSQQQLTPVCSPFREGDPDYFSIHDQLYKLEEFHELSHHPKLLEVMEHVLGPGCFPHPLSIMRLVFPHNRPATTPPHQDFPNNQGSPRLTAAWIPLADCPISAGALRVLSGSQAFGTLPLQYHLGPGNRAAKLPPEAANLEWHCSDFTAGDVLLFGAKTVHAACHNLNAELLRLSVDFRYQPAGDPLTQLCLEPHFQRLSWEDIYQAWTGDRLKYYWRRESYTVVPWDDSLHRLSEEDAEEGLRMALRYAVQRGELKLDLDADP